MGKWIDITGQRFGRLVAFERIGVDARGESVWAFQCDCGEVTQALSSNARYGLTSSCGCLGRELHTTHGMSGSKEHHIWRQAKQRCTNPRHADFKNYGGRGISMCERWSDSFDAFLEDMGECPPGRSWDRIDTNGNYEPENCRWATNAEQARNKRTNVWVEYRGERMVLKDFAAKVGVGYGAIKWRMKRHGVDAITAAQMG